MSDKEVYAAIFVSALVTALIRFAPFLLFRGRETPPLILRLGKTLPYAVMGMLCVYCLKDTGFSELKGFLPALLSGGVTVLSYIYKRNTLLSILCGTVLYMILVQRVFI